MTFILIVAVAVLALMVFSLRERVADLEWKLSQLTPSKEPTTDVSEPEPASETIPAPTQPLPPEAEPPSAVKPIPEPVLPPVRFSPESIMSRPVEPGQRAMIPMASSPTSGEPGFDFVAWIKDGFLIKMGALLFFLGIGLFLSYAFSNNWVSPEMRIFIGFVIAGAVYVLSVWRMRIMVQQGLVLNALATSIVLATVFAAQFAYQLFNPTFALIIMAMAIASSVLVAVQHNAERLALAAAGAGLVIPFLTNVPEPSLFGFLSYLLVLTLSFAWVVYRTGWTKLILLLLVGVEGLMLALERGAETGDTKTILLFVGLFALVFYGAGLMSNLVRKVVSTPDLFIVGLNAMTLLYWIHLLVPDMLQAVVAFLIASVAAVTAYFLLTEEADLSLTYMHTAVGLLFGFVATAYLFSGFTLTLALTAEVAFIVGGALWLEFRSEVVNRLVFLFALPIWSSLSLFDAPAWQSGWLHPEMVALAIVSLTFLGLAGLAFRRAYDSIGIVFGVVGLLYLVAVTLLSVGAANESQFSALASIALAIEIAGLIIVSLWLRVPTTLRNVYAISFALPVLFSIAVMSDSVWQNSWWHLPAAALYVVAGASMTVVIMSHYCGVRRLRDSFAVLSGWFLVAIPWLSVHAVFSTSVSHAVLTIWYGLYTVGMLGVAIERRSRVELLTIGAGFGALPGFLSLFVIAAEAWSTGIFHTAFLALFTITVITLAITVWTASEASTHIHRKIILAIRDVYAWAAGIYGVVLVWLVTHAVFADASTAISVSLFTYVVVGLALYISGRLYDVRLVRVGGMVLLIGVVIRLIAIDVWSLEMGLRVLTFAGVGILFLATSFLETNLSAKQQRLEQTD